MADSPNTRNLPGFHLPLAGDGPLTMSTVEIADLTGKRHDNVLRDADKMLEELADGGALKFEGSYKTAQGKEVRCLNLPKRETLILVSGYSVELRARIIDRWQELEAKEAAAPAIDPMRVLNDPAAMRGLLLTYSEKVLALEADKKAMQADVDALDKIARAEGTFCRTDAAKMLGIPPRILVKWMRTNGWTYRHINGRDDIAYQSKIAAGLLENKVTTGEKADGSEWASTSPRVTAKGLTILAKAFPPAAELVGGVK